VRRPEILAPAGSEESFAAALASGADAVYLGVAEGFNARARSTAFTLEGLTDLVRRAHAAGARLYLTLNTLVFESELEELERMLRMAIVAGVDALIVQDPATAFLARRLAPELRLHASTQMTISSAEGATFAATLGIDRVVLPRELSAREVGLFCEQSPLEAEVFVHGALCMSWSGQCLTSEAFSGRSANRGQCSQACRMPYDAIVDGEKQDLGDVRYLLSPQDLAGHEALPELVRAGVHSLKIEGRYKGAPYVTTAVDSWRNWRDAVLRGVTDEDRARLRADMERTALTYSRGGSVGFLAGDNHQELVVATTPKHRGLELGVVQDMGGRQVLVQLRCEDGVRELLRPGLGVVFELLGRSDAEHDPENAPGGPLFGVESVRDGHVELRFGQPGPDLSRVRVGDGVRLTGDPEIQREALRRIKQGTSGRIPLTLVVSGRSGESLGIEARANSVTGVVSARASTSAQLEAARGGTGLDRATLEDKIGALGGSAYRLDELDLSGLSPGLFVPVSELKQLRRELVAALDAELVPRRVVAEHECLPGLRYELRAGATPDHGPPALVPLCRTEEQLDAVIQSGLSEVELDWMEMVGLTRAVERARSSGLKVTLATVRVQKPGEEAYDRRIAGLSPDGVLVRHWGALMHFSRAGGTSAPAVHGDFSLNVTNSLTAHHLLGLGLDTVTASHDLDRTQLLDLLGGVARGRVALTLHHHIPTFHNSHCVYAHLLSDGVDYKTCGRPCEEHRLALRDYAGHEHPVVVDVGCRNTVFNAKAQSAAPLVPELLELGVRRFRVEFVWETVGETARVLAAYRQLLAGEIPPAAALEAAAVHERYGVTTPLRARRR
jgi:U32 family peptidase